MFMITRLRNRWFPPVEPTLRRVDPYFDVWERVKGEQEGEYRDVQLYLGPKMVGRRWYVQPGWEDGYLRLSRPEGEYRAWFEIVEPEQFESELRTAFEALGFDVERGAIE